MQLQVIRDKLLSLQSESTVTDVPLSPWAAPQAEDLHIRAPQAGRTPSQPSRPTPQAIAIETLKQRSGGTSYGTSHSSSSNSSADDDQVSHEMLQLKAIANKINDLSQQQTCELLQLKRSTKRAAISLRRQGVSNHPQLNAIQQFIEQSSSASVPTVEIDSHGQFSLHQIPINLNQAEAEAIDNARILRRQQLNQPTAIPFSQPVSAGPNVDEYLQQSQSYESVNYLHDTPIEEKPSGIRKSDRHRYNRRLRLKATYRKAIARLQRRIQTSKHQATLGLEATDNIAHVNQRGQFSWIDGIIWFVGAAIIRILLNALVINYSILKLPLLLLLVGVISYSIYRIVLSKSTDMSATYRVGTALVGLFIGSLL